MLCVRNCLKTALPVIGFTAAFWPLAMWYFRRLVDGGDEPMGLAVLLLTACMIWKNKQPLHSRPLLASSLFLTYGLIIIFLPQIPPMLRCIPALLTLVFYYGWQRRPGWMALLFLSLPVVASMQFYLGYPMRLVAAEVTHWLLTPWVDGLVREGTTLSAHGKIVGVDPPCSGIRMLWFGQVITNIIASLTRMAWPRMIIFNITAVGMIILCNSLRATLLYAPESGMFDIPAWAHEGVGILCYLLAAVLLIKLATWKTSSSQSRLVSTP
ncbi:MAG: archaeosortase/exosortase family protein [Akkermansiaceae bacterium]|nr:archaeosortase/exosortase family protein [Akkermansiaceae bacterium]